MEWSTYGIGRKNDQEWIALSIKHLTTVKPYTLQYIKGDSNPNDKYVYQKELYEPRSLIQVSSKSVEKWASYRHLKNSIWPTLTAILNI